jgi:hypothetical protein
LLSPAYEASARLIKNSVPASDRESYCQQMQRNIVNQYLMLELNGIAPYPNIRDAGFRVFSQFEEDGIILYVLVMIGFNTRRVVEVCCRGGNECMSTNLILNHGFDGYLFDGDENNIHGAEAFFRGKKECLLSSPALSQAWITAENANDLLINSGARGEVDLFSLDIDGNDYWVWKAVTAINPRMLILETHNAIPADRSLTIEYRPDFNRADRPVAEQDYISASLLAMQKLCKSKGYRMIGAHRHGFNVPFLREDEGVKFFPEVNIEQIHDNHWTRLAQAERWPTVKDMPWVEV